MPKRIEPKLRRRMPSEIGEKIIELKEKLKKGKITEEDFHLAIKALNRPVETIHY